MKRISVVVLTVAVTVGMMASAQAGISILPVPESGGTFALLALGLIGLAVVRRKLAR